MTAAAFSAVCDALWIQRGALQDLLYRLVCEQYVLTADAGRFLAKADDEIRAALTAVRTSEVIRAAEVEELTRVLDLDTDASLAMIVAAAPQPWRSLLAEHRSALRALTLEVDTVAEDNRRLLRRDRHATRDSVTAGAAAEAARQTAADVRQLSLVGFLR
jgi:hypothetical protein